MYCALPGFTVIVPADAIETAEAVKAAANMHGPFYIRLSRSKTPLVYAEDYHFALGKAVTMQEGEDVAIMATGIMVAKALVASEVLAKQGINCRVINIHTLKPLDEEAIVKTASEMKGIVVAEEHLAHGGLGSRVAQVIAREKLVPMSFVNLKDRYALSGKAEELLQKYDLTAESIELAVKSVLEKK